MSRNQLKAVFLAVTSLSLTFCGDPTIPRAGDATFVVTANLSGTSVAQVVVEVSASDIPTPLVFNIPIVNQIASGPITVPSGSQRTVAIAAYDAGGVETHSGSATINAQPGANTALQLVLQPLTGDLPIQVTLGSYSVIVTPSQGTLAIGDSLPLSVALKDWMGNTITGTVSWASHDPGVAEVSGVGMTVARHAGNTTISATFRGATGVATITVTP